MHDGAHPSEDAVSQQLQQAPHLQVEHLGHDVRVVAGLVAGELLLHRVGDLRPLRVAGHRDEEVCSAILADVRQAVLQLLHHVPGASGEAGRQDHPAHGSADLFARLQDVLDAPDGLRSPRETHSARLDFFGCS